MLKNKIYKYFTIEILKTFITILFAFTSIAWTIRAVNFLDLVVENGHSITTYLSFSLLNVTNILTKFIPLAFLLTLVVVIRKLERQNELLILWTTGVNKIKLVNLLFVISLIIFLAQLIFATIITPSALNKSRELIRVSDFGSIGSVIKIKRFSDAFDNLTIYIENKNNDNLMSNIFIRDDSNTFSNLTSGSSKNDDTTIIAKTGYVDNKKMILFDGIIQNKNIDGEIETLDFKKTELLINPTIFTRTITKPKLQETFTSSLIYCALENKSNIDLKYNLVCPDNDYTQKKDVVETLSRRIGMPLYIPLISLICSFLLVSTKEKKFANIDQYFYFFLGFVVLIVAELLVRYSGFSFLNTLFYFLLPVLLAPIIYLILIKRFAFEKISI